MSDLLASLVDRALGRAPVLQRRQPTPFEPVGEAKFTERSKFGNAQALPEEEMVVESSPPSQQKSGTLTSSSHLTPPSSRLEEPQQQQAEYRPQSPQRYLQDVNPLVESNQESARPKSVAIAAVSESPSQAVREEQSSRGPLPQTIAKPQEFTVTPQRLIETIVERRVEREVISEHSTDTPAIKNAETLAHALTNLRESSRDHQAEQAKQPLKTKSKPLSRVKEETIIKPVARTKPENRRDAVPVIRAVPRTQSVREPKQPAPPTIHVTIGRVEVRATPQAPARPRVAPQPGPKMSLEDYLRSRGEGNK